MMRGRSVILTIVAAAVAATVWGQPAVAADGAASSEAVQRVIRDTTGAGASVVNGAVPVKDMTITKGTTPSGEAIQTLMQTAPDATSVFAVLRKGQSEVHFDGLLPAGGRFQPTADGGLVVVNNDDAITYVIAAPWAKDAAGRSLPTTYAVSGTTIVQRVDTAGAVFPVVADPTVKAGTWKGVIPVYYAHFTWTETWKIKNNLDAGENAAKYACELLSGNAESMCKLGTTVLAQDVRNNVNAAIRERKCLALRIPATAGAIGLTAYDAYRRTCDS